MADFTVEEKLSIHRCFSCGIIFAIPEKYEKCRREDHATFRCPNGHSLSFPKKTEETAEDLATRLEEAEEAIKELRNKNTSLVAQLDQKDAQIEILEDKCLAVEPPELLPPPPPPPAPPKTEE